jgi:hypothetical protein
VQTWFRQDDIRFTQRGHLGDALRHYESGARLQLNQVEKCVPELEAYTRCLERDLALPSGSVSTTVVASTLPAWAEPHFDSYPAFTVHLRGTKRWFIGPEVCRATLDSFVLGHDDFGLRRFFDGQLPDGMPDDALVVDVAPGSVLYMPSGVLHAVQSHEHSFSIAFDLIVPRWSDLVVRRLTEHLQRSARWRGFALGLGETATESQRQDARRELDSLLSELPAALAEVVSDPDEILLGALPRLMPPPRRRYRLGKEATIRMVAPEGRDDEGIHVHVDHPVAGASEIEITPELAPFCRWLLEGGRSFSETDALHASRGALQSNVRQLMLAFLETGGLEAVAPGADASRPATSEGAEE